MKGGDFYVNKKGLHHYSKYKYKCTLNQLDIDIDLKEEEEEDTKKDIKINNNTRDTNIDTNTNTNTDTDTLSNNNNNNGTTKLLLSSKTIMTTVPLPSLFLSSILFGLFLILVIIGRKKIFKC